MAAGSRRRLWAAGRAFDLEGIADVPVGLLQTGVRLVLVYSGQVHDNAQRTLPELVIETSQLDHVVLGHPAGHDHGGGGDPVEDKLLRGAGLEPRRAGKDLGPRVKEDPQIAFAQ